MRLTRARCWLIFLALGALPSAGLAHSVGQSALSLAFQGDGARASWRIALRDVDGLLGLDRDHDRAVSVDELAHASSLIADYLLDRIELDAGSASCATSAPSSRLDGAYLQFEFDLACPTASGSYELRYDLFFDHDASHTAQVTVTREGRASSHVLTANARRLALESEPGDAFQHALEYVRQGVVHIWIGYDHVLFLLTLLLPAVLIRTRDRWEPAPRFGVALAEVVKIVSAFTLAHSLTLSLASLGVVLLPSRWVEATIAASVCLAALNNLYAWVTRRTWLVACGFGLIHGFGFASVLAELGLPKQLLLVTLVAFNAGVELGQLAIVLVFLPLAFAVRRSRAYEQLGLRAGSLAIAAAGLVWLLERALDLPLERAADMVREASLARLWPLGLGATLTLALVAIARLRRNAWATPLAALLAIASTGYGAHVAHAQRDELERQLGLQLAAARASFQQRSFARTETLLAQADRHATALGDVRAQAEILARSGALHLTRADLARARDAHERALALYEELGDDRACAGAQRALGLVARLAGDSTLAARAYRRALALHERLGLDTEAARDAGELAQLYRKSKQHGEAELMSTRALELAGRAGTIAPR